MDQSKQVKKQYVKEKGWRMEICSENLEIILGITLGVVCLPLQVLQKKANLLGCHHEDVWVQSGLLVDEDSSF